MTSMLLIVVGSLLVYIAISGKLETAKTAITGEATDIKPAKPGTPSQPGKGEKPIPV